jgi:putative PIN family toxin of toxin-antitoxin system
VRIVLDTNILIRANTKASPQSLGREILGTTVAGPHTLILSPPILIEVGRVLAYPHVQARWPMSKEMIEEYLVFLEAAGIVVEPSSPAARIVSDPDDDPILQTAIVGRADVLCSRDDAFHHATVERVCTAHGIRILDDIALMQELRRRA